MPLKHLKKTLLALMVLAGVAGAAEKWSYETPTVDSGEYTIQFNQSNYVLNDATLYNYLYGVFVEGGTLTFNLGINYTGTNCNHYQALLHVGKKDTGFSIYANGGPNLIVSPKHNTSGTYELSTQMSTGDHSVAITLTGDAITKTASVSYKMDGATSYTSSNVTLAWSDMAWDLTGGEAYKYSTNIVAPGWTNYNSDESGLNKAANSTTLTSGSAIFTQGAGKAILVPEPTTATLSLLALAGLAARRRRASR